MEQPAWIQAAFLSLQTEVSCLLPMIFFFCQENKEKAWIAIFFTGLLGEFINVLRSKAIPWMEYTEEHIKDDWDKVQQLSKENRDSNREVLSLVEEMP